VEFLRPDGIHLLADDLHDLQERSLRQQQMRINPRRHLADVPGPQQQSVAGNFCFRGVFPQSGNKNLAPTHEFDLSFLAFGGRMPAVSSQLSAVSFQRSAISLHRQA
jgi:hypothetical protein